jgi:ParB/RepB/Spo0J family partition protein
MTKQRVEGKATAPPVEATRITSLAEVPVKAIDAKRNVRITTDDELVKSIKALGLLQPIVVRENDGRYELVAGRRRLEAVKKLGWEKIPAVVHGDMSDGGLTAASLSENIDRRPLSPIEEAEAIDALLKDGWTVDAVAALWARSDRWVEERLALLTLPAPVKQRLAEGAWPVNVGLALLRAQDKKLVDGAIRRAEEGNDPADIVQWIKRNGAEFIPKWLHNDKECLKCNKRGGNLPTLFGYDTWQLPDEKWHCYNPGCLGGKVKEKRAEVAAKAEKEGLKLVSYDEYVKKHGHVRGVHSAENLWPTLGEVQRNIGAEKFKAECAACPNHGLVLETMQKVCTDRDCYKKKIASKKRAEKKAQEVAKESSAPADLYPNTVRQRIHAHERRWLEEQLAAAMATKGNRRLLEAVILARAFEAVVPPVETYHYEAAKNRAVWKDLGLSPDENKLLHEVIQMDDAAREKLRLKTAELALRKAFDTWPYAAGLAAGVEREPGYKLTDEFLDEAGFTKRALLVIAGEQKIDAKPTAKKGEVQKAVAAGWSPGQLPKVVAEDWRHNLKPFAAPAAKPKKRAAKAKAKKKSKKAR